MVKLIDKFIYGYPVIEVSFDIGFVFQIVQDSVARFIVVLPFTVVDDFSVSVSENALAVLCSVSPFAIVCITGGVEIDTGSMFAIVSPRAFIGAAGTVVNDAVTVKYAVQDVAGV